MLTTPSEPQGLDIVERLRERVVMAEMATRFEEAEICEEAASEIERLRSLAQSAEALLVEAEAVVEPFGATGAVIDSRPAGGACWAGQSPAPAITFGHLRRASAFNAKLKEREA